jgi:hypothetical protein
MITPRPPRKRKTAGTAASPAPVPGVPVDEPLTPSPRGAVVLTVTDWSPSLDALLVSTTDPRDCGGRTAGRVITAENLTMSTSPGFTVG